MPLPAGSVFAGFTIVRMLGSGGMGEVYLVDHPRLPRREALKILPAALTADNEFRQRFVREADLAAGMWHPHIVAVHDRGEFDGQLWITMDYVEGTDAAVLLRGRFPAGLPPHFAAEIVTGVADALDHAHERGLLHRDVKPANILLSDSEPESRRRRVLLSDFGIARKMDDASGLTATNMTVGSIAYAAPEQLMGATLDGQADQYALATTAFHLLTGKPPFDNSNAAVIISNHLTSPPPRMADRRPDLAVLDAVISKGMAKDPADRYGSCSEFAQALADVVAAQPRTDHATMIGQPAAKTPAAQPSRVAPPPRQAAKAPVVAPTPADVGTREAKPARSRRTWVIAAVAAILVAAAVAVGVVLSQRSSDSGGSAAPGASPGASSGEVAPDSSLVPASRANGLLVSAEQLATMTGQPLEAASTSAALLDASGDFRRPECVGSIYPLESQVYADTGYTALRQSLSSTSESAAVYYIVDQSVALLPSADRATKVLDDSKAQWQSCAGSIQFDNQDGSTVNATLAAVESRDNVIVQNRTVPEGVTTGYVCQHTMGVQSNVVAEAVVCGDTDIGNKSQEIVAAILANSAG
ncbi:serine/threonine-protein kinase PknH/PknJ [Antrihabitans sp. YC2-6]|uniref:serine/threonine-protein kinase PknH/PknJ n=1 Tax=Antrihabitans sp. YC2-6 TaxID=2799498 RepID=UPI0018F708D5|nr:serine/threonine-protein kinase PknH/PknJ [Antrihabitans sp. YC2-6]MBJ8348805.1 sensor domain-containing protein [Antrihabitans sp. YC2-6]